MTMPAGHVVTGADTLALQAKGYTTDSTIATGAVSGVSTTETVAMSITWTAVAGYRYKVTWEVEVQSTVALDIIALRLRWKNSVTADTTGTQFRLNNKTAHTAGNPDVATLVGNFTGQAAGTITVVGTIKRFSGTGTLTANASSNQDQSLLVEVI